MTMIRYQGLTGLHLEGSEKLRENEAAQPKRKYEENQFGHEVLWNVKNPHDPRLRDGHLEH